MIDLHPTRATRDCLVKTDERNFVRTRSGFQIRMVARYCDVLPSGNPGPLTRALDRDGIVEHWQLLERIAHLERSDPAAAAWCDEQLRRGAHAEAEAVVAAAETLS